MEGRVHEGEGSRVEAWIGETKRIQREPTSFAEGFMHSLRCVVLSKLNLLLFSIPLAVFFEIIDVPSATFVFSLVALVPLAERLGFVTEELATYTNDALGGLLNATFGNATEIIICAVSLNEAGKDHDHSYLRIVQLSLLGSIMGNLLLVLGTAFLVGGIAQSSQSFNREGMGVNSGMLIMAVSSILLPSLLSQTGTEKSTDSSELDLSRFESVVMLILYGLYLFFQLFTHKHLYEGQPDIEARQGFARLHNGAEGSSAPPPTVTRVFSQRSVTQSSETGADYMKTPSQLHRTRTMIAQRDNQTSEDDELQDNDMGLWWALTWLAVITVLIAILSDLVVGTIDDAHDALGIPLPFLSTIVLPLVGNAAEHASAILFAYKDRMEITLGVAVGSATQIAVLVIPITVLLAWIMGQPLSLDFEWFEAFTLFLTTMIVVVAANDGTSNWIKGLLLVVTYILVSAAFWVHSDSDLDSESD